MKPAVLLVNFMRMSPQILEVTIDSALKNKATQVLEGLGLDMDSAVRVFLKKVVATHSIPFALAEEPDFYEFTASETEEILQARQESRKREELSGPFSTVDGLMAHLRQVRP